MVAMNANSTSSYSQKREAAFALLQQTISLCEREGKDSWVPMLNESGEILKKNEFIVVVCGECSRGKSSLINAYLEEDGICPVSAMIATNNITTIRYGESERIVVFMVDGKGERSSREVTREQLAEYVTEGHNEQNYLGVTSVDIEIPSSKLRDGLVLIDTPGIGSLNIAHTATTMGILPRADGVVFVGDATEPLIVQELHFIEQISRCGTPILHALTHIDQIDNVDDVVKANRVKLAASINAPKGDNDQETIRPEDVLVAPVSCTRKLDALKYNDAEDLQLSNFAEFETQLWKLLNSAVNYRIFRVISACSEKLTMLEMSRQAEQKDLISTSRSERESFAKELQQVISQAQEFDKDRAQWELDFSNEVKAVGSIAEEDLNIEFCRLDTVLQEYLKDNQYASRPLLLAETLEAEYKNAYASVVRKVNNLVGNAVVKARRATSLSISGISLSSDVDASLNSSGISESLADRTTSERIMNYGREARVTMGLGALGGSIACGTAGGVIGGIMGLGGGPAGALAGAIIGAKIWATVGAFFGAVGTTVAYHEQNKAKTAEYDLKAKVQKAMAEIQPPIKELRIHLQGNMKRDIGALCTQCITNLRTSLRERSATLSQTQRSIKESMLMADDEAKQKLDRIKRSLVGIQQVTSVAKILASSVADIKIPS